MLLYKYNKKGYLRWKISSPSTRRRLDRVLPERCRRMGRLPNNRTFQPLVLLYRWLFLKTKFISLPLSQPREGGILIPKFINQTFHDIVRRLYLCPKALNYGRHRAKLIWETPYN